MGALQQPGMLIAGAGQAGAWIARTLRAEGYAGPIGLIGDEVHLPYSRPPLSKAILAGADDADGFVLMDEAFVRDNRIDLYLGQSVRSIDRGAKRIQLGSGESLAYDKLFLTTGSRARLPSWLDQPLGERIHVLRTIDDALRLRRRLIAENKLLVVGGGWIGLEVAATARGLGLEVVVVEAADRLCARSVPAVVSDYLLALHKTKGVELRLGAAVSRLDINDGGVTLILDNGDGVEGDLCVIGIGNIPNVEAAEAAGLEVANGVVVDAYGRTSDADIYAAGDVTNLPCHLCQAQVRRESWANAQNQAIAAAKAALGKDEPYREAPWLWSDQYDCNIQIVGVPERGVTHLARGPSQDGAVTWLALDGANTPLGAVSINSPRDLRAVRKALAGGPSIDLEAWPIANR